jgi:hypothetical protein
MFPDRGLASASPARSNSTISSVSLSIRVWMGQEDTRGTRSIASIPNRISPNPRLR